MTYGWAILAILLVGAAMWQMGFLSMGKQTTPGKTGFSQIVPVDWRAQATGTVELSVINEAGTRLTLTGVSGLVPACTGSVPGDLLPGQVTMLTLTGCSFSGANTGDYFRMKVSITYDNPASTISHNSVGDIWGPLE